MLAALRKYLIAGILVWLPLGVTVLVVKLFVDLTDQIMVLVPPAYHPEALLHISLPGVGIVLSLLIILVTGMVAANMFGRRLVAFWESLLARIPLVRSVYSAVKQLAETVFSPGGQSFRKVLLVEYPRRGLWTLAFQTGTESGEAQLKTGHDVINIYVPTTPNPTSGFFIMVPRDQVVELDMSVDEGLKMILSMGVVVPPAKKASGAAVAQPDAST